MSLLRNALELTRILDYEEILKSEKMRQVPTAPPKSPTNSSKEEALDVSLEKKKSRRTTVAKMKPQSTQSLYVYKLVAPKTPRCSYFARRLR